ncbi:hypothetical protein SLA2020_114050 [Shorea laevis]
MAGRIRSTLPLLNKILRSDSIATHGSIIRPTLLCPQISKNYATAPTKKEDKVKVPLVLFGGSGNYASALYLAAFAKDLSVPADTRVKAVKEISTQAKFSDVTKNFLVLLAENGRLRFIDSIAKRFAELTMAHKGEVKAIVTTVIPLPPQEEKELKETLQEILGQGKKVQLEQKIDPSILGGITVEFDKKVFDLSIKTRAQQMERFLREPVQLGNL